MYYSFILSNVLSPGTCGETNTKKMEKIQERALDFIYNDHASDYESLLLKSY